jgi:hypothetical protein
MKKQILFQFTILLLGAILLAACAPAAQSSANPVVPVTGETAIPAAKSIPTPANAKNPSSKVDACVLLTKDDVSKALGQPAGDGESKGLGGVCSYKSNTLSIDMTVLHTGGTKFLQQARAKLAADALDIPGVGDEAFYNPFSYTLIFRKGDGAYMIFLSDSSKEITEEDRQAKEKALSLQMLTHMP